MRRILLSRILLKRYAPFYLALLVMGVVMALLFLRPDSGLGLTVEVSAVKKFPDFPAPAGFKLGDPVIINADVGLQGDFEPIKKVTLTVAQDTGDAGFTGFTVNLPFPQAPNYAPIASADISGSLPVVGGQTQGKLFVDVRLVETTPDPFGYGYGYRGKLGDGFIKYTITYVPPKIRGHIRPLSGCYSYRTPRRRCSTTPYPPSSPSSVPSWQETSWPYPRYILEAPRGASPGTWWY